jgi:hypothetical protein
LNLKNISANMPIRKATAPATNGATTMYT